MFLLCQCVVSPKPWQVHKVVAEPCSKAVSLGSLYVTATAKPCSNMALVLRFTCKAMTQMIYLYDAAAEPCSSMALVLVLPTRQRSRRWFTCMIQIALQQYGLGLKPILNWVNCLFAKHPVDSLTNYYLFLNWTFTSLNMVWTVRRTMLWPKCVAEAQQTAWLQNVG